MKHNNIPNSVWTKIENGSDEVYELNSAYAPPKIKVKVIKRKNRYEVCAMIKNDPTRAEFYIVRTDGVTHYSFQHLDNAKTYAKQEAQHLTPEFLRTL